MRYTKNMEPQAPKVRSLFSGELVDVLDAKDCHALVEQIGRLTTEDSPAATWAEALGTRLQIRDFLVTQKTGLAELMANQEPNLKQNITNYLHGLDTDLTSLTGDYGQDRPPATPQMLKEARIGRLTHEPADSLVSIVAGFSEQETSHMLLPGDLVNRTLSIRDGIVERLWSAAQSYNEGDTAIAQQELHGEAFAVNNSLDTYIGTILVWEDAA